MVYLVSFFGLSVAALFGIPGRRAAMTCTAILAFLVAALRFSSGFDFIPYYTSIVSGDWRRFEPANRALMWLAHDTDPQVYFVITAGVVVAFNLLTLLHVDRHRAPLSRFAMLAFICFPVGLLESFNMIRQLCAVSIFVYAFVRRDNKPLSLMVFALAWVFHESAILFLPVLLVAMIREWRLPWWSYILALLASTLAGPSLEYVAQLVGFYGHYFQSHTSDIGVKATLLFVALFGALLLFNRRYLQEKLANELNLLFVGCCLVLALAPYGVHISRASWYGLGIYPVLIGAVLRRGDIPLRAYAFTMMGALFAVQLYLAEHHPIWDGLNQYRVSALISAAEKREVVSQFYAKAGLD